MRTRHTPLNASFVTLIVWMLCLGLLTGRTELFLATVPLVCVLAASRIASPASSDYTVNHEVSAERLFEHDPIIVTLTIRARTPPPPRSRPRTSRARTASGSSSMAGSCGG